MNFGALRDLNLAGVRWELDEEKPQQLTVNRAQSTDNKTVNCALCSVNSGVVPPIAPTVAPNISAINDIDSLIGAIRDFEHPLKQFAKNVVPPQISNQQSAISNLLVITDMPSGDDDTAGKILTGPAGELFDKMLGAIGISRDNVSIIPVLFWRTPGGRTPTNDEIALARPFVSRAIELLQPTAILTLGTFAAQQLSIINYPLSIISIPHPNYLLLKPDAKRDAWDKLQNLQKLLKTGE